ncbi:MAG: hypothetical protein FWC17_01960 [Treponema sp.]|nr:hypothetical protein [Treponema sp.]
MMAVIFIAMILLLYTLGKGIDAKFAAADKERLTSAAPSAIKAGNDGAVTAAISAAVNEYRKTNK